MSENVSLTIEIDREFFNRLQVLAVVEKRSVEEMSAFAVERGVPVLSREIGPPCRNDLERTKTAVNRLRVRIRRALIPQKISELEWNSWMEAIEATGRRAADFRGGSERWCEVYGACDFFRKKVDDAVGEELAEEMKALRVLYRDLRL